MSDEVAIIQNLKDAGCDDKLITNYLKLEAKERTAEQLHLLACHRCNLITTLHNNQKKNRLFRLSYLLHQKKLSMLILAKEINYEKQPNVNFLNNLKYIAGWL